MSDVDTFTRERLTPEQVRATYAGTTLLVSTIWSNYTALTPATYLRWDEDRDRPVVQYLGLGATPYETPLDLSDVRLYRTVTD